jgi:hypothetical protein
MSRAPKVIEAPPEPAAISDMRAKLRALQEETVQTLTRIDRQLALLLDKVTPMEPVRFIVSPNGKVTEIARRTTKRRKRG